MGGSELLRTQQKNWRFPFLDKDIHHSARSHLGMWRLKGDTHMHLKQIDLFDFAFNNASIGMSIVSLEGRFVQVNRALCSMLGYDERELLALNFQSITHQDDLEENLEYVYQLLNMKIEAYHMEKRYIHKQGHPVWCLVNVSVVHNEKGEPIFLFSQFHDITAEKMTEIAQRKTESVLREKEESFRILLEELPLAVIITRHGICQYVNRAGIQLIGARGPEEVLGVSTNEFVDPCNHDKIEDRRRRHRQGGKLGTVKYKLRCYDGEIKFAEGVSIPTTFHGEEAVIGVFQDVTERKKEEERIIQSEKLSIVGQLAAGIAHEIRNPITSINGFLKLLRSLKTEKEQYYDIIESELKSIEIICNELLILAKPNLVTTRRTNLVQLLEQSIALMSAQATMKNSTIDADLPSGEIWLHCEPNQIKQVFVNVIKNAIEAMPDGGHIYIGATVRDGFALITIEDEGCGIPAEKLEMLGQPFYTTKDSGTGLGLMVSYNIMENHGGSISVDSLPQQGTTFTVALPILDE